MSKETLLDKANNLKSLSTDSISELEDKKELILHKINITILQRKDLAELVGDNNIETLKDNHRNHLQFMLAIYKEFHVRVFVDTILWVFRTYRSRGFQIDYWTVLLNIFINVYKSELSDKAYAEVSPFYHFIIENIPVFYNASEID